MKNEIMRLNSNALTAFSKTLSLANQLKEEQEHRNAEWFDTPEKRVRWWFDLEPQWRKAFNEAVLLRKNLGDADVYNPADKELQYLFQLTYLDVCGNGDFINRNNYANITFQLSNLTGVANLSKLERIDCDYNGLIDSLEPLRYLTELNVLWCDNNQIEDLSPLMELEKLTALCCWNNKIRNVEPLASLVNLRDLTLGHYDLGNPIEDFTPIGKIYNLRHLDISACGVENLKFLENCRTLKYVNAPFNGIELSHPDNSILHTGIVFTI